MAGAVSNTVSGLSPPTRANLPGMGRVHAALAFLAGLTASFLAAIPAALLANAFPGSGVLAYVAVNIPHAAALLVAALLWSYATRRKWTGAFTSSGSIQWKVFALSAGMAAVVLVPASFIGGDFSFNPAPTGERMLFFTLALLVTPIQCLSEEYLYRALLGRIVLGDDVFRANTAKKVLAGIVAGGVFLLMHSANPEFTQTTNAFCLMAYYFAFGFLSFSAGASLGGFEVPWAVHTVNNLAACLLVTYPVNPLGDMALFAAEALPSPPLSLFSVSLALAVAWAVTRGMERRLTNKTAHMMGEGDR